MTTKPDKNFKKLDYGQLKDYNIDWHSLYNDYRVLEWIDFY